MRADIERRNLVVTCESERAPNHRDLVRQHDRDVRERGACRRCGGKELIHVRRPPLDSTWLDRLRVPGRPNPRGKR